MNARVLIIEDDPGLASQMRWCLEGFEVDVAAHADEAMAMLRRNPPDVITLDLGLPPDPGGTRVGFELLEQLQHHLPATKIIVVTGREEREHAVRAVAMGAYDFYQKPVDADTLQFVVARAARLGELEREIQRLSVNRASEPLAGIIAASTSMLELTRVVERVAPTDATVMILGETGTGKELVARAIHDLSERAKAPFVAINCAAIPENLLESELFGHEKGSFTGAVARKIGKIEHANGGTLFLDEIGDMPLPLQAKILRFLQERQIERVGGTTPINVDVRVVSATHRPINEMVSAQQFREDLYFRLGEISIEVPPLRDREGDAALLARAFVQRGMGNRNLRLMADAVAAIESHSWPGNVRELENRVKRACIMADGNQIKASDLQLSPEHVEEPLNLRAVRDTAERTALLKALSRSNDNIAQAARLLGVSRPTLYNLLAKHELDHGR
jgi:two-component system NtrC family response regulator